MMLLFFPQHLSLLAASSSTFISVLQYLGFSEGLSTLCDDDQLEKAGLWQCNADVWVEREKCSPVWIYAILKFWRLPEVQFIIMCTDGGWEIQGWVENVFWRMIIAISVKALYLNSKNWTCLNIMNLFLCLHPLSITSCSRCFQ